MFELNRHGAVHVLTMNDGQNLMDSDFFNEFDAMLDQVEAADDLRAEMLWQARDWARFAQANRAVLAPARTAAVLRQAVALVMLGDEPGLAALRKRYLPALRGTKAGEALGALASPNGAVNPAALDAAMAGVSETAADGDLLLLARG